MSYCNYILKGSRKRKYMLNEEKCSTKEGKLDIMKTSD